MHQSYLELLWSIGCLSPPSAYTLLLTRDWMLAVPRSPAACEEISVNALGFAGSYFVSSPDQLERIRMIGPMTILQRLAPRQDYAGSAR